MKTVVAVAIGAFCICTAHARGFQIAENGRPVVEIVQTGNAQVDADIAFFTNAVRRCTGASIPVVCRRSGGKDAIVFKLSSASPFEMDRHSIGFPDHATMMISGTTDSCRWALNRILEKDFGVVFCFPGPYGTHFPQRRSVSVERMPFSGTASLAVERHLEHADPYWERCLGGRELGKPGQFYGHSMNRFLPPEKYRGTPLAGKIFPEKNGKRRDIPPTQKVGWQPCFSSMEAAEEAAKNICEWLDNNPWARCCSISVNDLGGYCECKACEKMNGGFGKKCRIYTHFDNFSDVYYTWANRVAERVARRHPNVVIGLLAYCNTTDPPSFPLHENLMPFLCTDSHQLMDDRIVKTRYEHFAAWGEKCRHIGNWGYDYGAPSYALPRLYIKPQGLFFDMKKSVCKSLDGYFGECMNLIGEGPKHYILYRRMFKADCDAAAELDRWYDACCGKAAAPYLKEYFRLWEDFWTGQHIRKNNSWYSGIKSTYFPFRNPAQYLVRWNPADMVKASDLMAKAVAAANANGDADQRRRASLMAEFHEYYVTKTKACGGDFPRIPNADTAVRFLKALPEICATARRHEEIAQSIIRSKDYEKAYRERGEWNWQIKGFLKKAGSMANSAILSKLNAAVRHAPASESVMDAVKKVVEDKRVIPEFRERLSTLVRVQSLPNLANGVEPEKTTNSFLWDFPELTESRQFYISFKITNKRVGKQGYWIYFAGWSLKNRKYRGHDEVMLTLGPGETQTVSFFGKINPGSKGGRLGVVPHPVKLDSIDELEVADVKLCEVDSEKERSE